MPRLSDYCARPVARRYALTRCCTHVYARISPVGKLPGGVKRIVVLLKFWWRKQFFFKLIKTTVRKHYIPPKTSIKLGGGLIFVEIFTEFFVVSCRISTTNKVYGGKRLHEQINTATTRAVFMEYCGSFENDPECKYMLVVFDSAKMSIVESLMNNKS